MSTVEIRLVDQDRPWADDVNPQLRVWLGIDGGQLRLLGYDGSRRAARGGASLSTGNYSALVRNGAGNHVAILKSATADTATPSAANSVALFQDTGVTLGTGLTLTSSTAGTPIVLAISHTDATTDGSHAQLNLSTGGANGGDPTISWAVSGGGSWVAGIDNDDSDAWVLASGTDITANKRVRLDASDFRVLHARVRFLTTGGTEYLDANPPQLQWYGSGSAGSTTEIASVHTETANAASHAQVRVQSGGVSGGDAQVLFRIGASGQAYVVGIDNSVTGDPLVIAGSAALGTTNRLAIDGELLDLTFANTAGAQGIRLTHNTSVRGALGLAEASNNWQTGTVAGDVALKAETGSLWLVSTGIIKSAGTHLQFYATSGTALYLEANTTNQTLQWNGSGAAGSTSTVAVVNAGTSSTSDARILMQTSSGSGGDPFMLFSATGVAAYAWGVDRSAALTGIWGATTPGTAPVLTASTTTLTLYLSGTQRLALDTNGNVVIGTAALATTATNGFLYIPTCAGAPTGVPTAFTGRVPLIFDTTNNRLYAYDGGWISAAFA